MGLHHARVFDRQAGVSLVAVSDARSACCQIAHERFGVSTYLDYRQMLDREALDLISIAVPPALHAEIVPYVIARGLPVLVEKPLAPSADQARQILRAVQASGAKLMVGHIERFNPAVIALARELRRGAAGRVLQLSAYRTSSGVPPGRIVGVTHDLAIHDIDVMCMLVDRPVARVQATAHGQASGEQVHRVSGQLLFDHWVAATVEASWQSARKVRQLTVRCQRGTYLLDYQSQQLGICEHSPSVSRPVRMWSADAASGLEMRPLPVEREEPLRLEIAAFVAAVAGDQPLPVAADQATIALEIADGLLRSAQSGHVVTLGPPAAA